MKQFVSAILLSLCALCASAQSGKCGENVSWTIADGVLTLTGTGATDSYVGSSQTPWTGNVAKGIKEIVISEGITKIGSYLFYNLPATKVQLPESLEALESSAFYSMTELNDVVIPKGVKSIAHGAFGSCKKLTSLYVYANVPGFSMSNANVNFGISTTDGFKVFISIIYGDANPVILVNGKYTNSYQVVEVDDLVHVVCGNLPDVEHCWQPETVAEGTDGGINWRVTDDDVLEVTGSGAIADYEPGKAPWDSHIAEGFNLWLHSNDITKIGANAFASVGMDFVDASMPSALEEIGDCAFVKNWATRCKLSKNIKRIGKKAFYDSNIQYLDFENGYQMECVGDSAFFETNLYVLDDNVFSPQNNIGCRAFGGVRASSVSIPQSAVGVSLGKPFYVSSYLKSLSFPSGVCDFSFSNKGFDVSVDKTDAGVALSAVCVDSYYAYMIPMFDGKILSDTVVVPETEDPITVTFVSRYDSGSCGESATWSYDKFSHVLTISGSGSLENYETTGSIFTSLGTTAPWFKYADEMDSVVVREGITNLGSYAFCHCGKVRGADLASSVTSFGQSTFGSCPLENLRVRATSVYQVNDYTFDNYDNCTLYVPVSKVDMFKKEIAFKKFYKVVGVCNVYCYWSSMGEVSSDVTEVYEGQDVVFSVTCTSEGYELSRVTINGVDVATMDNVSKVSEDKEANVVTFCVSGVGSDMDIEARFEKKVPEANAIDVVRPSHRNDARFNLGGQKVGSDFRGIVIVNGKARLQK